MSTQKTEFHNLVGVFMREFPSACRSGKTTRVTFHGEKFEIIPAPEKKSNPYGNSYNYRVFRIA
jgi:hypothetical protein